jgi:hypothetical protein
LPLFLFALIAGKDGIVVHNTHSNSTGRKPTTEAQ